MIKNLQKAIIELETARDTMRGIGCDIEISREISMVSDIIDTLEGAANFIRNRDDEQ